MKPTFKLIGTFKDQGPGKGLQVSLEVEGAELNPHQVMACLQTLQEGTMNQIQEKAKEAQERILVTDKVPPLPGNGKRPPFGGRT